MYHLLPAAPAARRIACRVLLAGLVLPWLWLAVPAKALAEGMAEDLAEGLATAPEGGLSVAEFEAHVTGKTLSYAAGMRLFGQEHYGPGRRVIWSVAPGECQTGQWYPHGREICFVYDGDLTPRCWLFGRKAGRLTARPVSDPTLELVEIGQSDVPPPCGAAEAGV